MPADDPIKDIAAWAMMDEDAVMHAIEVGIDVEVRTLLGPDYDPEEIAILKSDYLYDVLEFLQRECRGSRKDRNYGRCTSGW